jgi:hypothetical protein
MAAICKNRYSGQGDGKWIASDFVKRLAGLRSHMNRTDRRNGRDENRLPELNPKQS